MNLTEIIKFLNNSLDLKWETFSEQGAAWLSKEEENGNIKIISWQLLNHFDGKLIATGVTSGVLCMHKIESILKRYYEKHNLGYNNYTIYFSSKKSEWLSNQVIRTESDLDQILPTIRAMVYDEILPFFERYQTVGQVYEKMERMEVKDISSFLYPPVAIRRMILKRLVNAPDFEEYGERILKNYEEGAKGPYSGTYAPFVPFLPDLFEELKTMEV